MRFNNFSFLQKNDLNKKTQVEISWFGWFLLFENNCIDAFYDGWIKFFFWLGTEI
jgi:hypothetical protein